MKRRKISTLFSFKFFSFLYVHTEVVSGLKLNFFDSDLKKKPIPIYDYATLQYLLYYYIFISGVF